MKQSKKGFTLVEIMIVVAIIGVLAAIAIPNFVRYRKTAQMNACIGNLKQIQSAIEQYRMAKGDSQTPGTVATLCGSTMYIKVEPKCPASGSTYTISTIEGNAYPICGYGTDDLVHVLPDAKTATAATPTT